MGFKCWCGMTFSRAHRYPEQHGCTFDFKSLGREAIAKAKMAIFFLIFLLFLLSSATACDRCVHQSKATYFSSSAPVSFYKDGVGCEGCFQIPNLLGWPLVLFQLVLYFIHRRWRIHIQI
ncbi:hypothetical protein NE237_000200 [Protea cynaroides]|uniref:AN1-type domain-containing protein n=1 Tax=Protea cynaroides TaxID=273540 RepID=A0A9Q0KR34_9MAGN|nr:hypothetical protein NE237_000200 [Protea cynaroides]